MNHFVTQGVLNQLWSVGFLPKISGDFNERGFQAKTKIVGKSFARRKPARDDAKARVPMQITGRQQSVEMLLVEFAKELNKVHDAQD